MSEYSPMMQHYLDTKEEYKDCILFYRLGDFYEMFFEDAKTVSRELDLVLTGKACGKKERAPMCGIPFHSADSYIARLVKAGYKIAICEQVEDPKEAKGIVKREVVKIVTPGTNIESDTLIDDSNNYLMSVISEDYFFGISFADVSTGDFYATQVDSVDKLFDEYRKFSPKEVICNESFIMSANSLLTIFSNEKTPYTVIDEADLDEDSLRKTILRHFNVPNLVVLGLEPYPLAISAVGSVLDYLHNMRKTEIPNMSNLKVYSKDSFMVIDAATRRNLELTETLREKQKKGSLFGVIDKTRTAMGARHLRHWIEQPLIDVDSINTRADAVEELYNDLMLREEIREQLNAVYDLERLMTRISYRTANPRDLLAFKQSIGIIRDVKAALASTDSKKLTEMYENMDDLRDLFSLIDESIAEEPPVSVHEGGIIKSGFSEEVDTLRSAQTDGKKWLAKLESEERAQTGIKTLKVKYNRVFGYYFEVTNAYKDQVPDYFIRKQTLTNAERFFTPKLKELENTIMGSSEKLTHLEYEIYRNILDEITGHIDRIQKQATILADIDGLCSLADVASKNNYRRAIVDSGDEITIKGGRHPVIEQMELSNGFIVNDTQLNNSENRVAIITGPNMAGKSTYMRQTALIVLLAQIGSFVPCDYAKIGVVDRIFTRVGASDDLASGQSTFMVEMNEVANILKFATDKSLLILDEIGRGTSTFDGLAIAWSVVEYISDKKILGAKTLFATHYHELTELEGQIEGVKNYCIAVKEDGDSIVFLRKIIPGGADKSYGIAVARLAGVPDAVTKRAEVIVEELQNDDPTGAIREINTPKQISLFDLAKVAPSQSLDTWKDKLLNEFLKLEIEKMTPMDAMNMLYTMQQRVKDHE